MPTSEAPTRRAAVTAARAAARAAGVTPRGAPEALAPVTHVYSHFEGCYHPFFWRVSAPAGTAPSADVAWVGRGGLEQRALTGVHRRIAVEIVASWP
jgi:hypothetical protein